MSTRSRLRHLAVVLLPLAAAPLTACTDAPEAPPPTRLPALSLVAFDSCAELGKDLRAAARASVGPYGFGNTIPIRGSIEDSRQSAAKGPAAMVPYSGTNSYEKNADEPDPVKTDGARVVTLTNGVLRVVDARARVETGRLDLGTDGTGLNLLLAGPHAYVLSTVHDDTEHTQVVAVDVAGPQPQVVGRYRIDGYLLDARQTDRTVRVVVRSRPRITFRDNPRGGREEERLRDNQDVIDHAPDDAWLPRYESTFQGRTERGQVRCGDVSRPASYSGASMVTVLTFDLSRGRLGTGDAVSVAADGDTVYGTGTSLYVTNDDRWRWWRRAPAGSGKTDIYRFSTPAADRPVFVGSADVPGWLINQYALSEWNGDLRVATTSDNGPESSSAVRVLRFDGGRAAQIGVVEGLGKGERIYAVRFMADRAYVVTFRQTDPLYTVDLADPKKPVVTGELKIPGYSAHLQPAGDNRLLGVGQEATDRGTRQGSQVSLFDVRNPAAPTRLAQYHVSDSWSEAESDPHAVLWWPARSLLVLPVTQYSATSMSTSAQVLKVADGGITKVGAVSHAGGNIQRSLVIGDVLWTYSDAGLQANDLGSLAQLAWLSAAR